jgi:hypothetical protein
MTPALREQEDRLRDEVAARSGSARA